VRLSKPYLLLLFPCLLLTGFCQSAQAQDDVLILDYSIKPVSAVSSGRFIKIAWKVKLRNEFSKPKTVLILFSFLDENEDQVEKVSKTRTLKAREERTVSDTVLVRAALANKIAACDVSVTIQ